MINSKIYKRSKNAHPCHLDDLVVYSLSWRRNQISIFKIALMAAILDAMMHSFLDKYDDLMA